MAGMQTPTVELQALLAKVLVSRMIPAGNVTEIALFPENSAAVT